jgi:undecaprenyl-diphosphatase
VSRRRSRSKRPGIIRPLLRIGAAAALGAVATQQIAPQDERARELIAARRSELLDRTVPTLTDLGSMYAAAGAAAALWVGGKRKLARDVIGSTALAWGIGQGMKKLYRRSRPYEAGDVELLVRKPAGKSYPSGHPAVAAAMVAVTRDEVPAPARGLFDRMPRFVGFSRVYVGAHYPTDVIGGVLIGRAVGDLWRRFSR